MVAKLEAVHPALMVREVSASFRFFRLLGFEPAFGDSPGDPKYAGVRRDAVGSTRIGCAVATPILPHVASSP